MLEIGRFYFYHLYNPKIKADKCIEDIVDHDILGPVESNRNLYVFLFACYVPCHATTYRIMLKKAGKPRIAIMVDSPYHMYDKILNNRSKRTGIQ